jgi:tetrapyrrole methylase family protein/MazG family protein
VQKKAAAVGMDFADVAEVFTQVDEELTELRDDPVEAELGDVLFAVVGLAMHLSLDPEAALRRAASRFGARFRVVEELARERGVAIADTDAPTLDALWEQAKRRTEHADGKVPGSTATRR